MWIVCITSVRHVLTVNGYGGRQTKENEKSWCFKGWETLVIYFYRFIYNEEYAYLCVGNNNTPLPPKSVLSIFCTDPG